MDTYTKSDAAAQSRLRSEEPNEDTALRTSPADAQSASSAGGRTGNAPGTAVVGGAVPVKRMTTAAAVPAGTEARGWIDSVKDTFHQVKDSISDAGQAVKDTVNGAFGTHGGDVSEAENDARQHVADARRNAADEVRDAAEKRCRTH